MALKNGCYLQVHFTDELKELLQRFSNKIGISQSKICEIILSVEIPKEVNRYYEKEVQYATKKKNETC